MKITERTLQKPAVGRTKKAGNGLTFGMREPENLEDALQITAGDEPLVWETFFGAVVVSFQNSPEGRELMKADGSTDELIREKALAYTLTRSARGGGVNRMAVQQRVLKRLKAEGKKRIDLDELDRLTDLEVESLKAANAEE